MTSKAAYLQALDALEAGAGANRLKRLMRTAWYERNRYFANRIAQTELHRAYANQVAAVPDQPVKGAEQRFMNGLSQNDQRQIAGSQDRLAQFRDGKSLEAIYNASTRPEYKWGRVGDNAAMKQFKQPRGIFTPYDDGFPKVRPDVSTPLRQAVIAFEEAHRDDTRRETGAFFNDDGSYALGPKTGKPDRVGFMVADLQKMAGTVYSHNHPGGASFSQSDVDLACEYGFAEIRAVTTLFRHSLSAAVWPRADDVRRVFAQEERKVEVELNDEIKTGRLRLIHYGFELTHRIWARVAMRLAIKYEREKS